MNIRLIFAAVMAVLYTALVLSAGASMHESSFPFETRADQVHEEWNEDRVLVYVQWEDGHSYTVFLDSVYYHDIVESVVRAGAVWVYAINNDGDVIYEYEDHNPANVDPYGPGW